MTNVFQQALETGKVIVRRAWLNNRSRKDQVSVQFMQEIESPNAGGNALVAVAQGVGNGKQRITDVLSFARPQFLQLFGLDSIDEEGVNYYDSDVEPPIAEDIFGMEVNISVTENTDPREYDDNGNAVREMNLRQAKLNPQTNEYLMSNGEHIYRHTKMAPGEATHQFLRHDSTVHAQDLAQSALDAAATA